MKTLYYIDSQNVATPIAAKVTDTWEAMRAIIEHQKKLCIYKAAAVSIVTEKDGTTYFVDNLGNRLNYELQNN